MERETERETDRQKRVKERRTEKERGRKKCVGCRDGVGTACSAPDLLVGLCKLYPFSRENMWWLNWRPPPSLFSSSVCCRLLFFRSAPSIFETPLHLSSRLILLSIYIPLFYEVVSLFGHTIITPILSIHHFSVLHLNLLLLCLCISLPPTPLPRLSPSPQLCYFLLCMEDAFSLWSLGK